MYDVPTVFHRLEAARLIFRIKAAAASISNKSRAAYIWVFHFYLRRKKLVNNVRTLFGEKSSKTNCHKETLIISIVLLSWNINKSI